MTSKERIRKTLEFRRPDCIGTYDSFCPETILDWQSQGYPLNKLPEEYFNFDFKLFDLNDPNLEEKYAINGNKNKFLTLSFSDPFEVVSRKLGRLNLLKEIAASPERVAFRFFQESDRILSSIQTLLEKGIVFDGAWIWGDLAYKDNLFFSIQDYKKCLFPMHKKLFSFLNSRSLPVIFHSDGKVNDLIPYLLEAGIRSLHPLDSGAGMDLSSLSRSYGKDLVFFGNIDINCVKNRKKLKEEIKRKLGILREGYFYLYHASSPVLADVSLEDYKFLLETVRKLGRYQ